MNIRIFHILLFIGLINLNTYGQDYNDTIINKNQDTIICEITFVNDQTLIKSITWTTPESRTIYDSHQIKAAHWNDK